MGLPGSGKSTLCKQLVNLIPCCEWINADVVREHVNDWDFSHQGRIRQAERMKNLANQSNYTTVILDFVCPLPETRQIVNADFIIWMNTISAGRFEDTNTVFVPPTDHSIQITTFDYDVDTIVNTIKLSNNTKTAI